MEIGEIKLKLGERRTIAGAPDGVDAQVLAAIARESCGGPGDNRPVGLLHVARDAERLRTLVQGVAFFGPDIEVVTVPAWDCLPYDRVSPNAAISSERMDALSRLAALEGAAPRPRILVTTVNAILQRVPARDAVGAAAFRAEVGGRVDLTSLTDYLVQNGYLRSGTVREAGEFAVRGGIIDIFPPGAEQPVRLDLFGEELEGLRYFDPLTQISSGKAEGLALLPVGEVVLDAAAIGRFRDGYRAAFGAVAGPDPLYEAVSDGRKHAGMEHWLPLFHERLETIFEYVPGAAVTLDHLAAEAVAARLDTIGEQYGARTAAREGAGSHAAYKPLPPDRLYLTGSEWAGHLDDRAVAFLAAHRAPDGDGKVMDAGGRTGRSFAVERAQPDVDLFAAVQAHIKELQRSGRRVLAAAFTMGSRDRLLALLEQHGFHDGAAVETWAEAEALDSRTVAFAILGLEHGFETPGLAVISEPDILGDRLVRRTRRSRRADAFISELSSLDVGDIVVHVDHGIGRYEGLQTIDILEAPHDCVWLSYAGGDRLFIPVENIEVLSRYGSEEAGVALDKLGGAGWQARKARLKKRIRDMAEDLVRVAAARLDRKGEVMEPEPGLYEDFCSRFAFELTDDQQSTIDDVIADLASGRPMDRLICGDVGFGKTEIALRAAFITAMSGKQVAIVAPTTLLSRQHYEVMNDRFAGFPLKVAQISRLVGAKDVAAAKTGLADGTVDIVVGTHALLSKSISFRDLGLLVVDEEQHFGVAAKERLKHMRTNVHVLTMTATPIPRTLQMALTGLRERSLIATPPVDRLAVRTFILPFDDVTVREAILREQFRGGQTFYVCPRIDDIEDVEKFLRGKIPEVRFAVAHGRMNARDLDSVMKAFYEGTFDVLVSTNIIESGLDVPRANTMIIHRADMFGLAQLYQLRGRIGRSKVRAYAYMTILPGRIPTARAEQRLHVIQTLDELGAGFSLASHDLDIRGAGNLLGGEQSGHIREVGFELYQEMLEEAVAAARDAAGHGGAEAEDRWSPQIGIGTSVLIPEPYIGDLNTRLGLYRRLARLETQGEIDSFAAELIDRFGPLPVEVEHLLKVIEIKSLCRTAGVEKVEAGPRGATLNFRDNKYANPAGLVAFISQHAGTAKLRPDHTLVYMRNWEEPNERLEGVRFLLENLSAIAAQSAASDSPAGASDPVSAAILSRT